MTNPFNSTALFLITTLFDLSIFILIIRVILAWVKADYYNPVTQFIIKVTQPLVGPLRRIIPTFAGVEYASIAIMLLLELLKFFLISIITIGTPNIFGLFILAVADILKGFLNVFFYAILIQAILSWVQSNYSPVTQILSQITAPILRPLHRIIPPVGGFDITPIPAMILLQVLILLIVNPLMSMGVVNAFG